MLLLNINIFIQEHADLIRSIMFNVIMFIVFLMMLNLIAKRLRIQVQNIERNTEYMKQDFRSIKQDFEITRDHINTLKSNTDVGYVVHKMLYETPGIIKNDFIAIKRKTLQLSAFGYIISTELGLREMISNNWVKILPYINDSKNNYSQHQYDLQVYCLYIGSCIDLFLSPDEIEKIKNYAYEEGHLLSGYYAIIGIIIKEQYFEEEGLTISKFQKIKK